jgi:nickel-dependent lactate racemase
VERISEGLLSEEVPIVINKKIFDYDLVLILGPVFPPVVGYSGGAKHSSWHFRRVFSLFPGGLS